MSPSQIVVYIIGVEVFSAPIIIFIVTQIMRERDRIRRKWVYDILDAFVKFIKDQSDKKEKNS